MGRSGWRAGGVLLLVMLGSCGDEGELADPCGARTCGFDQANHWCGDCLANSLCDSAGACQPRCSPSAPTGMCSYGQTCVSGACCLDRHVCGSACCAADSSCGRDRLGRQVCQRRCQTNLDCPGEVGHRCCNAITDGSGRPILEFGLCSIDPPGDARCRCAMNTDCSSRSCTPQIGAAADASVFPIAPLVCSTPACRPYGQCPGVGMCPAGYCNLCDAAGNCYCAQTCASDGDCHGARCTTFARSAGSCPATQTACAPR